MWIWTWDEVVCIFVYVLQAGREPRVLFQCSHLHMASLRFSNIGDDGVRDLGAAMLVSTTLTTLV